jgi:putative holliday junction resolvase
MKKILALDVGNEWTGTALSDSTQTLAKPLQTVKTTDIASFLTTILQQQPIETIVVGHPRTMKGTASQQTIQTEQFFEKLKHLFPTFHWILWDERLSSKHAEKLQIGKSPSKKDANKSHSVAAAFILDTYLTFLSAQHDRQINNSLDNR